MKKIFLNFVVICLSVIFASQLSVNASLSGAIPKRKSAAVTGKQSYSISQDHKSPNFTNAVIDPEDVKLGQKQTMTVSLTDKRAPITQVVAEIQTDKGIVKNTLKRISGTDKNGVWEGYWIVKDTHDTVYITTFKAVNKMGEKNEVRLSWTDPECADASTTTNGGVDLTLSNASCTTSAIDGADGGQFKIDTGGSVTVAGSSVLSAASLLIAGNGTLLKNNDSGAISIVSGGVICMTDVDSDGYPLTSTLYADGATCNAGRRRRSLMTSTTALDCNDSLSGHQFTLPSATYYPDIDHDTYTISGVSAGTAICGTASTWATSTANSIPGVASVASTFNLNDRLAAANGNDCNDGLNTVYQNLTGYADADGDLFTVAGPPSSVCSGASLPSGYLASVSNPTDVNDSQRCAAADTNGTVGSALYNTTCQKCYSGGLTPQANNQDLYSACTASSTACADVCNKTGPDGNCNGGGACNTGGGTSFVSNLKVCTGAGTETNPSPSVYASLVNSCTTGSCSGNIFYRACNGAGASRSDNTGAAIGLVYAVAGQSLSATCVSGANGSPGPCQKCNGSSSPVFQASNEDLYNQCTLTYDGCSGGSGTNGICVKTASVGDLCSGTSTACAAGPSANVANQKVCSGGSEVVASDSLYASIANVCSAGGCLGTVYYRSCNGAGATRTDNTAAASGSIWATSGNTFTAACANSTATPCTTQTACKNLAYCNGGGSCNTPTNVTGYNEGFNCTVQCKGCSGGACVNIPNGTTDTWGSTVCNATHYVCDGGGACTAPTTNICNLRTNLGISCATHCSNIGAIGCVSAHPNTNPTCDTLPVGCSFSNDSWRYCKCTTYAY